MNRLVIHKGFDSKGKVVAVMVQTCGMLIPFTGGFELGKSNFKAEHWIKGGDLWSQESSIADWKRRARKYDKAVRFQRITYTVDSLKKGGSVVIYPAENLTWPN